MKMLILVSGKAGSGKDTVGDYLVSKYGFRKYAFADRLKEIALLLGWNGVKDERGRRLLQELGTVGRNYDPEIWIHFVFDKISKERSERVVITDCRYVNEFVETADFARENGYEFLSLHVVRPGAGLAGPLGEHESERENIPAVVVKNDGTLEELYGKIDLLISLAFKKSRHSPSLGMPASPGHDV